MKTNHSIILFLSLCFGFVVAAHFLPIFKIKKQNLTDVMSGVESNNLQKADIETLMENYTKRPLFISNDDINSSLLQEKPATSIQWSPFDYELIGVSKTSGKQTGWFRQKNTGSLVSARQNDILGEWRLEILTKTEARLKLNDEVVSLKLFQGLKKR